jgi:hypothetical protein
VLVDLAAWADRSRETFDTEGILWMSGAVSEQWLRDARDEAHRYIAHHGSGDHDLADPSRWDCPSINEFVDDPRLTSFLASLTKGQSSGGYHRCVLRILDGSGGVHGRPYVWHYDGCAVTMIVPIVVPADGSGALALFPSNRPHRRSATFSAAENLVVKSWPYARLIRRRFDDQPARHTFPLQLGDAYVFCGYRTLHGTLPWPAGTWRVTLVIHYGNPYGTENWFLRRGRALQSTWQRRR